MLPFDPRKRETINSIAVTPKLAAEFLSHTHGRQRRLKPTSLFKIADLMRRGLWFGDITRADKREVHPDPILFDEQGRLMNGQHRLSALIQAGRTIRFRVEAGAPPRLIELVDSGSVRTQTDRFGTMVDFRVTNSMAATFSRFLCGMLADRPSRLPISTLEIDDLFARYAPTLQEITNLIFKGKTRRGITRSGVVAAIMRAWVSRPALRERILEFADLLYTGEAANLHAENKGVIRLRDYLMTDRAFPQSRREIELYSRTIVVLDAFLNQKVARQIVPAVGELFPIPEDRKWAHLVGKDGTPITPKDWAKNAKTGIVN